MSCLLSYVSSISGDCSNTNSGGFTININGEAPGYTITWNSPSYSTQVLTGTTYTITGLSGGSYSFNIVDSCIPNTILPVSIFISTGTNVEISSITNTTCSNPNGSIVAYIDTLYDSASFYLYETTLGYITSGGSLSNYFTFNNLSAGTYYVIANNGGGCTGSSESCVIQNSNTLDYGFYIVNNSSCSGNLGSIYITGLTGTPPYTFLWSPNGETTSYITGLTSNTYSVSVVDFYGCNLNSSAVVSQDPPLGFGSFVVTQPSCYSADGQLTITITGGTAPFYYLGSNGDSGISFSNSFTFTGLSEGYFNVKVTDAGLCKFEESIILQTPGSLQVVDVTVTNSNCNNLDGTLSVTIFGGSPPYIYNLIDPSGNTNTVTGFFTNWTFSGLFSGVYTLEIMDLGPCTFSQNYTISNVNLYNLSLVTSGTSCNLNNGEVTLYVTTGGTPPYHYEIDGRSVFSNSSAYTFSNLSSGNYTATVTDAEYCTQILPFVIQSSTSVNFSLLGVDTVGGNDGIIYCFITEGEPTFSLEWSSNVNGQTGLTVTGLTAGTYSLKVTDNNNCALTRTIDIMGYTNVSSYQVYKIGDDYFENSDLLVRRGPEKLLLEGYYDLTSNDFNCVLNQTNFTALVTISGVTVSQTFFTGSTLTEYPTDNELYEVVKSLIFSFSGISDVMINYLENTLLIETTCFSPINLQDVPVDISLKIGYDISCVFCT